MKVHSQYLYQIKELIVLILKEDVLGVVDVEHTDGTDYAAASGTEAVAVADGEVRKGKFQGGDCGGTIIINHDNGYTSSYCHMRRE